MLLTRYDFSKQAFGLSVIGTITAVYVYLQPKTPFNSKCNDKGLLRADFCPAVDFERLLTMMMNKRY